MLDSMERLPSTRQGAHAGRARSKAPAARAGGRAVALGLLVAFSGPAARAQAPEPPGIDTPGIASSEAGQSAAEQLLAGHPQDRVVRLLRENVVMFRSSGNDEHAPFVQALVVFESPLERVVRLMVQTARQIEYRSELKSIETVDRFSKGSVDEHRIRFMFLRVAYRLRNEFDFERHRMRWALDPDFDNGLTRLEGFWHFYALDDERTLGHFGSLVDVGAMPQFFQDYAAKRQIPETMERVRLWVNSDGRWRP